MKQITIALIILIPSLTISVLAEKIEPKNNIELSIQSLENEILYIKNNQLNYRIEKDLLKEFYSSSLQSFNIILTIILASITLIGAIIGFTGLKNIKEIKENYESELKKLNKLYSDFELKIKEIDLSNKNINQEYISLRATSIEHENKIKILEIQEKAQELISAKNHLRALQYIDEALKLDPLNLILLRQKSLCLNITKQFDQSFEVLQKILTVEPNHSDTIQDLLELYLLNGDISEYSMLIKKHSNSLKPLYNGRLIQYFEILLAYKKNDEKLTKTLIADFIDKLNEEKDPMGNWRFSDAMDFINRDKENSLKNLIITFLKFLSQEIDIEKLKESL